MELAAAVSSALQQNARYIIALRIDDVDLESIFGSISFIDYDENGVERLVSMIRENIKISDVPPIDRPAFHPRIARNVVVRKARSPFRISDNFLLAKLNLLWPSIDPRVRYEMAIELAARRICRPDRWDC